MVCDSRLVANLEMPNKAFRGIWPDPVICRAFPKHKPDSPPVPHHICGTHHAPRGGAVSPYLPYPHLCGGNQHQPADMDDGWRHAFGTGCGGQQHGHGWNRWHKPIHQDRGEPVTHARLTPPPGADAGRGAGGTNWYCPAGRQQALYWRALCSRGRLLHTSMRAYAIHHITPDHVHFLGVNFGIPSALRFEPTVDLSSPMLAPITRSGSLPSLASSLGVHSASEELGIPNSRRLTATNQCRIPSALAITPSGSLPSLESPLGVHRTGENGGIPN